MNTIDDRYDLTVISVTPYHGTAQLIGRDGRMVDRVAASSSLVGRPVSAWDRGAVRSRLSSSMNPIGEMPKPSV